LFGNFFGAFNRFDENEESGEAERPLPFLSQGSGGKGFFGGFFGKREGDVKGASSPPTPPTVPTPPSPLEKELPPLPGFKVLLENLPDVK